MYLYMLYVGTFVSGVASQYHGASVDCAGCNKPIRSGSITVQAPRIGEEVSIFQVSAICAQSKILWGAFSSLSSAIRQQMSVSVTIYNLNVFANKCFVLGIFPPNLLLVCGMWRTTCRTSVLCVRRKVVLRPTLCWTIEA